jgi:regulatory protein
MEHKAHDVAIKYLYSRDRTAYEIGKHLEAKGFPRDEIDECLEYLTECGLVSDENYCEKYIVYGMEKGRGPLRLKKELYDKGIAQEIINIGLEAHFGGDGEKEAASNYMEKYISKSEVEISGKELAKIGRRLSSQGFHSHIIYDIINRLK